MFNEEQGVYKRGTEGEADSGNNHGGFSAYSMLPRASVSLRSGGSPSKRGIASSLLVRCGPRVVGIERSHCICQIDSVNGCIALADRRSVLCKGNVSSRARVDQLTFRKCLS